MYRLASMMATAALLLSVGSSGELRTPPSNLFVNFPLIEASPVLQGTTQSGDQGQPAQNDSTDKPDQSTKGRAATLQPMSRLSLVRYVDGEYVQVVRAIPVGKKGFHMKAGVPLNENALRMAVSSAGSAINPGDRAQITNLDFKDKQIVVDINGGGRGKTRLRDRIHLEVGGLPTATTTPNTPVNTNAGATLYLDFDKSLPEMSAEDLEQFLSGVLDFSKRHSAAIQWVETLPPEIQKAIQDKQPVVGMDHDMVLAAMGRPDRKVREKGTDGSEIEDWIYGTPPAKTIFVSFEGDKVTKVHQYPQ
ncbi:MAG TPA: hypothetical protein VK770_06330 [Candidatus Acidoferrum sp.]|jgi:hypothetical protein|nr:hypothetical protein [Candidatus Acidoferrum sp.]